jgi:hypothetical protein
MKRGEGAIGVIIQEHDNQQQISTIPPYHHRKRTSCHMLRMMMLLTGRIEMAEPGQPISSLPNPNRASPDRILAFPPQTTRNVFKSPITPSTLSIAVPWRTLWLTPSRPSINLLN